MNVSTIKHGGGVGYKQHTKMTPGKQCKLLTA
jgi:hypothetical protein